MNRLPDIGLGTACLLKATLPEFIEVAADNGFRRITARPHAFMEAVRNGHSPADLRQRLADAGIAVTMIDGLNSGLPGVPHPDELDASVRAVMPPDVLHPPSLDDCLAAADALGASMLNLVAYRGRVVPVGQMAEAVRGICRRAAAHGVEIVLEFVPESGIPDLASALQVQSACSEPNCRLLLDVFHLGRSGGTVEDVRRIPPGAIAAIQISDRGRDTGAHVPFGGRLMPGDGDLPLREMIEAALDNNPAATVDVEVLSAELNALPADEAAARLAAGTAAWRKSFEAGG